MWICHWLFYDLRNLSWQEEATTEEIDFAVRHRAPAYKDNLLHLLSVYIIATIRYSLYPILIFLHALYVLKLFSLPKSVFYFLVSLYPPSF